MWRKIKNEIYEKLSKTKSAEKFFLEKLKDNLKTKIFLEEKEKAKQYFKTLLLNMKF